MHELYECIKKEFREENVEKSVEEEVNKAMQERKKYLDALSK